MAPEIALNGLKDLPKDYRVLDPMSGSGMVLGKAAKLGLLAIGYDLDPLANMISRANGNFVDEEKVRSACKELLSRCQAFNTDAVNLPWIDDETQRYIDFWFAPKQQMQLRILSFLLVTQPFNASPGILDILKIAISRHIITKEPKISLARDTAHSRPHRTIVENNFDVFETIPKSLDHVLAALQPSEIKVNAKVYRGDARRMGRIQDTSIDCIITSPPYLNAIDYIRGHKLSLVWLGYSVSELRKIRARSVGTEIAGNRRIDGELQEFFSSLHSDVGIRKRRIIQRYYRDLCDLTAEAFRVLKPGRQATYVIGNSCIKGHEIQNYKILKKAATRAGFDFRNKEGRDIPENRRYMPLVNSGRTGLAKRMRKEWVVVFEKPQ